MTRLIIPFLVLAIGTSACKSHKSKKQEKSAEIETVVAVSEPLMDSVLVVKEININPTYEWPRDTDPFNILDINVSGNILALTVEYGGGCREHIFKMNWTGAWMKSMPPKINLWLEHENNDDNCRALIREKLFFDLSSVRYASSNSVVILVNGEEEKSMTYSYPKD